MCIIHENYKQISLHTPENLNSWPRTRGNAENTEDRNGFVILQENMIGDTTFYSNL